MSLKLHPGERVSVCYATIRRSGHGAFAPSVVVRAVVEEVGPVVVRTRAVGGRRDLIPIYASDEEGVWWARGWNTKAARALKTAVALS